MMKWGVAPCRLAGLLVAAGVSFAGAAKADGGFLATCTQVTFHVALDDSSPPTWNMVGEICSSPIDGQKTLQILLHGATYNRHYWDFGFRPELYSYVRYANDAGFATLALDRIGAGQSDHPDGALVTMHAGASTIHQVVTAVRSGNVKDSAGHPVQFDRVVLVGHSFGSNVAWTEAGIYQDVDGVILSGISHDMNPPITPATKADAYPAQLDPLFANANLPPNYLTSVPGTRGSLFYYLPGADPAVIDIDEQTKDVVSLGAFLDEYTTYGLTENIHVPVLNVDGDHDTFACELPSCTVAGTLDDEGSFYPVDACYTKVIIPGAGHDLNLHEDAPLWFAAAQGWMVQHFGLGDGLPSLRHCGCRQ